MTAVGLNLGILPSRRLKLVRQTEVSECGLACLTMIADFYGLQTDLGSVRRQFPVSLRGTTMKALMTIAEAMGMVPRAVKVPLASLSTIQLPAILHWDLSHYVVVERVTRHRALIHDPDGRSRWFAMGELSAHFTGVAMELRPHVEFEPRKIHQRLRLGNLWARLVGTKRAVVQTLLLSVVLQLFVLASPFYLQLAIDNALPALDTDLLVVLALGFGLFTIINAGVSLLRSYVLLSAGTSIGFGIASNVARRLMRLPVDWFEKRQVGDVLSRFQSVAPIQRLLTEGAVAGLIDGSLAVVTLVMMFVYSPTLAFIALTAFTVYVSVRVTMLSLQRSTQEAVIAEHGKEQSVLIETLRGITTLRMFGRETVRFSQWQNRFAEAVNADVSMARLTIWQQTANLLIFGIENVLTIWLAVRAVIRADGFSLGMLFAYIGYKTQFVQKASSLVDQAVNFRLIRLHLERLSDVVLCDEDPTCRECEEHQGEITGDIELTAVDYRYASSDPLVLSNVNMRIGPGEHVAITGPSGCGKSTLLKILLGLVDPISGELLIGGKPLAQFGRRNYQSQIAAVLQEDHLFSGTLSDNIALFDEDPNLERIVISTRVATIHDEIMAMPLKYDTRVGDMGSTLSGGQKQRILLARALYRQPRVLVMDEGTAHLDGDHEAAVNQAISMLGITKIVVAHRRETIEAADRVIVMADGQIIASAPRREISEPTSPRAISDLIEPNVQP